MIRSEYAENFSESLFHHLKEYPECSLSGTRAVVYRGLDCQFLQKLPRTYRYCHVLQSFRPFFNALVRHDFITVEPESADCELAVVMGTRDKTETFGLIARALAALKQEGTLLVVTSNSLGSSHITKSVKNIASCSFISSKSRCKVISMKRKDVTDASTVSGWLENYRPQPVATTGLIAKPGMFSWKSPDKGSELLADNLPAELKGHGADPGCGYGYLSYQILKRIKGVSALSLFEAEETALQCAMKNISSLNPDVPVHYHWHDVVHEKLPGKFDWIVMNPPFHSDGREDSGAGQAFIKRAAEALNPGGMLFVVFNSHLPYQRVLMEHFGEPEVLVERHGFTAIRGVKKSSYSI